FPRYVVFRGLCLVPLAIGGFAFADWAFQAAGGLSVPLIPPRLRQGGPPAALAAVSLLLVGLALFVAMDRRRAWLVQACGVMSLAISWFSLITFVYGAE